MHAVESKTFSHKQFEKIRMLPILGEPGFVGKDVCDSLGYVNSRDAIAKHVADSDKGVAFCDTLRNGNPQQEYIVINESGFYSLVFSSKMPKAKEFTQWVTSEVLPSIRRTGSYVMEDYNLSHNFTENPVKKSTLTEKEKLNQLYKFAKLATDKETRDKFIAEAAKVIIS